MNILKQNISQGVDVVLVNYKTAALTLETIVSLSRIPQVGKVVVIDNDSTPETLSVLQQQAGATVKPLSGNHGFAAAVNVGVGLTASELVLLLNTDAEVNTRTLAEMTAAMARMPQAGVIGAVMRSALGAPLPLTALGTPTLWSLTCFAVGLSSVFPRSRIFNPEQSMEWLKTRDPEVAAVSGGCMLLRRSVWDQLAGMDERFFLYSEDVDLCSRIRVAGYYCYIASAASVIHEGGASSFGSGTKLCRVLAGKITFYNKHYGRVETRLMSGLLSVGVAVRALLSSLNSEPKSAWIIAHRTRAAWAHGYPKAKLSLFP